MKILVISNAGFNFTVFRKPLLLALQAKGMEVHVVAPGLGRRDKEYKILNDLGITTHNIAMQRTGLNPISDTKLLLSLRALFIAVKPDIVLSYTIKPVVYGTLAAYLAKVPQRFALITGLGYAFQENDPSLKRTLIRQIAQLLYRTALKRSHGVIFQNPDDEKLFLDHKLLSKKTPSTVVHGTGVDITRFSAAPFNQDSIRFLFVGRLLADKGIRELLAAAKAVKSQHPEVQFDIVGPLDENPESIQQTELDQWVKEGIINYFGRLDDVRPRLAAASVFVLPSYREGTPLSTLEALAVGRAVITTDAPGCRETVIDGENGFLIPVQDSHALSEAMLKFIQQPDLIQSMGQRSRAIAEEKYDVNTVNASMLKAMGLSP